MLVVLRSNGANTAAAAAPIRYLSQQNVPDLDLFERRETEDFPVLNILPYNRTKREARTFFKPDVSCLSMFYISFVVISICLSDHQSSLQANGRQPGLGQCLAGTTYISSGIGAAANSHELRR